MSAPRLTAREMLALVCDSFDELTGPVAESAPDGPLSWPGYDASRARAAERTGETESVVCGIGGVAGTRAVLIAFEFGFLGGSLGERTGDRWRRRTPTPANTGCRWCRWSPPAARGCRRACSPSPSSSGWPGSRH